MHNLLFVAQGPIFTRFFLRFRCFSCFLSPRNHYTDDARAFEHNLHWRCNNKMFFSSTIFMVKLDKHLRCKKSILILISNLFSFSKSTVCLSYFIHFTFSRKTKLPQLFLFHVINSLASKIWNNILFFFQFSFVSFWCHFVRMQYDDPGLWYLTFVSLIFVYLWKGEKVSEMKLGNCNNWMSW